MRFMQVCAGQRRLCAGTLDTHGGPRAGRRPRPRKGLAAVLALAGAVVLAGVASAAAPGAAPQVIGGQPVPIGDYPYVVSLQGLPPPGVPQVYTHGCGGILIAERLVATARHCIWPMNNDGPGNVPIERYRVVAGRTDLSDESAGETAKLSRILLHPGLANGRIVDFAILELATPIHSVAPVPLLPRGADLAAGTQVRALGWGLTSMDHDDRPAHMQMVDLPVVDMPTCLATSTDAPEPATDICAVLIDQAGVCYGDSGGPLLAADPLSGEYHLAGLTSRGGTVCTSEPGVFTSLSAPAIRDWDWESELQP